MKTQYRGVCLDKNEYVVGMSEVLLEHAYFEDDSIIQSMNLLSREREWYKTRIVWAAKIASVDSEEQSLYEVANKFNCLSPTPKDSNWSDVIMKRYLIKQQLTSTVQDLKYLLNFSKKEYINLSKLARSDKRTLHPLPFLTLDTSLLKSGCFLFQSNLIPYRQYIGYWSGDLLGASCDIQDISNWKELKVQDFILHKIAV